MMNASAPDPETAPPESSGQRRQRFARRLQAAGIKTDRARSARFRQNAASNDDRLKLLRILPIWISWDEAQQNRLAQAAAILSCRSAIDMEISGPRLSSFARAVGDDLFEALCGLDLDEADQTPLTHLVPRPDMLLHLGWKLLAAGLPVSAAGQFAGAAGNDPAARLTALAIPLVMRHGHRASEADAADEAGETI
ncbi:MAG: hypothetical protein HC843_03525 [Sphingomonadales bacterium]|nr:hypothetical protein [Sphingomonadales bacterium]